MWRGHMCNTLACIYEMYMVCCGLVHIRAVCVQVQVSQAVHVYLQRQKNMMSWMACRWPKTSKTIGLFYRFLAVHRLQYDADMLFV